MTPLTINGVTQNLDLPPDTPLLYVLRNDLRLNGPKFGCGLAQCGACTVLLDGQPIRSCVTTLSAAAGAEITTLEGLGTIDAPSKLQKAFIDEQAAQCGYCTNGMIVRATALLRTTPKPSDREIRLALDGNLCRCGAHNRIVRAVQRAAAEA